MTNQRLTKNEIEGLRTVLDRLKRLSKSNALNSNETRVCVYDKTFTSHWDDRTVREIANSVRIFHQEDIYALEQILK